MKIRIDYQLAAIVYPLTIAGFALIWSQVNFWCALGVFLLAAGASVRRTA